MLVGRAWQRFEGSARLSRRDSRRWSFLALVQYTLPAGNGETQGVPSSLWRRFGRLNRRGSLAGYAQMSFRCLCPINFASRYIQGNMLWCDFKVS